MICGTNSILLPADKVGCGKPIEGTVHRCRHCDVPFHLDCLREHLAVTKKENGI
jgi:hypothetical protein